MIASFLKPFPSVEKRFEKLSHKTSNLIKKMQGGFLILEKTPTHSAWIHRDLGFNSWGYYPHHFCINTPSPAIPTLFNKNDEFTSWRDRRLQQFGANRILEKAKKIPDSFCMTVTRGGDTFILRWSSDIHVMLNIKRNRPFPFLLDMHFLSKIPPLFDAARHIPQGFSKPVEHASAHEWLDPENKTPIFLAPGTKWDPLWRVFRQKNQVGVFSLPRKEGEGPICLALLKIDLRI